MERLQKIIAHAGICSRRKAETLIEQGKVQVNGKTVKLGDKADAEKDKIKVNNKLLKLRNKVYYILNKPKGVLVTASDPDKRNTIFDLPSMDKIKERVFPIGRLDAMSEGLLILTNDGEFANTVAHPRYETEKVYMVRVEPKLKGYDKERLEKGVMIEGKKTGKVKITLKEKNEFTITIHEGRNRIIRKMLEKLKYKIYMLKRLRVGPVELENLKEGEIKQITIEKAL